METRSGDIYLLNVYYFFKNWFKKIITKKLARVKFFFFHSAGLTSPCVHVIAFHSAR